MRQAYIIKSFTDEYKKLLKNTLFTYLDSHWFVSRDSDSDSDSDSTELYVIRIKDGHEDIEYSIQSFGSNFEVVTDNEKIAKLLSFAHQLFNTIDNKNLIKFNESETIELDLFSNWSGDEKIELDEDRTFKVHMSV